MLYDLLLGCLCLLFDAAIVVCGGLVWLFRFVVLWQLLVCVFAGFFC